MKTPKTPKGKLVALRRAEQILRAIEDGHAPTCDCLICDASMAAWKARYSIERPGWEIWIPHDAPEVTP